MKKDTATIKRILRQTDNTNLHGYFQNEDDFIICNGYSIIKFDMNNIDFIADIDNLNNNTNKYYNYKSFNEHITKNQDARNTNGSQTIEILVEDLKMWKKHAEKGKPFIIPTKKGFMGLNPYYLLDLASLTRQDKNKLIKIKVLDKKAPLYIDGNGVKAILCQIVLNKTNFSKDDYLAFLDKLADCYDLEKNAQEEKTTKKANKAAGIVPTLQPNEKHNGFTMSFYGVDYFMLSDAKRITKSIITEFIKAYCKRNNFSDTVLNDMLNSKIQLDNIKARIEKATFILNTNADNSAFTYIDIKTKYAFNGCMYFECDNKLVLIDCVLPTSAETKEETTTPDTCADDMSATDEETPKNATIQDNAADIVKADTVKDDTCTATETAATTDTATNDRKRILHGFYMTFKNRDIFVATNEDTKRRYIVQAFINEMINISNHLKNITEEKRNNILNDEDVLKETKKRITPATIEEIWTYQENHIRITSDNNNMIVNHSLNNFKTIIIDCYSANEGGTPAQEKSLKFFSGISRLNNQLTETITQDIKADLQADNRQTETTQDTTPTTQDTPHKTSNTAVSLFVVTDKPAPVKLPTLKQLDRIPTYTQRIVSRLQPLKSHRVYNTRVDNKKPLKKAYNDFVGTVSCYSDKCAIGGGMVAVNTS